MEWTKELLINKWIIVKSQEESDQISKFLESLNIPNWKSDSSTYKNQLETLIGNDKIIIIICEKDYMFSQYYLQRPGLQNEDEIYINDLLPKEDLKSKLIELFSKPETIFYLRNKEEAIKLDKLLKELNYLELDYYEIERKNALENWYIKDECDILTMKDIYNAKYRDLSNLNIIEITFDNLLDYVK